MRNHMLADNTQRSGISLNLEIEKLNINNIKKNDMKKNDTIRKNINSDIELRSGKIRNLLDKIPSSLVRWGTVVIVAVIV